MSARLAAQLDFLCAADRLKTRPGPYGVLDGTRRENLAERAWHKALTAWVFFEDAAPKGAELGRVLAAILVQDLLDMVDPATGDALVSLLPKDQEMILRGLFDSQSKNAIYLKYINTLHDELHVPLKDEAQTRTTAQWAFLTEADKLKHVTRATTLCDASRFETSGEHSWHVALYALILGEWSARPVETDQVVKMLLLHDLVEIDAGDAPIFGTHDVAALEADEAAAAERIFGLLPPPQARALRQLWSTFEAAQTVEAQFGKSLDRFQPPNQNLRSGGGSWVTYDVSFAQIEQRVGSKIAIGAPALWTWLAPQITQFLAER